MASPPIPNPGEIIASFLAGLPLRQMRGKYRLADDEFYQILQVHFRKAFVSVPTDRLQNQKQATNVPCCGLSPYPISRFDDIGRVVSALAAKDAEILQLRIKCQDAEHTLAQFRRQLLVWMRERDSAISELETTIRNLKQQIADQDNCIRELQEQAAMLATENNGLYDRFAFNIAGTLTVQEQELIRVFSNAADLESVCLTSGLSPEDVFQIVQKRFCRPHDPRLPGGPIDRPLYGDIDRGPLITAVKDSSFLFSLWVFDAFFGCRTVRDLRALLAIAFHDFAQMEGADWSLMAAFVLELIFNGVVYDKTAMDNLEESIAALKSLRGRLTRRCRTIKAQHSETDATAKAEIRQLRAQLAREEGRRLAQDGHLQLSEQFHTRTAMLKELITLAASDGANRYSQQLYYMSVRVLFRSYSAYKFLRNFLTIPSPTAIYGHFHDQIDESLSRLRNVALVGTYLSSQIEIHPAIAKGAVLAVDAVSCSNSFIGVKQVEHSDTGYLFVILLQPVIPTVRCSPLFVIKSPSGIGNKQIQSEIDKVLTTAQEHITRVFVASDGDASYNNRHAKFMAFWSIAFRTSLDLEDALAKVDAYSDPKPLSDLLHLSKNFRIRFLKYALTFDYDGILRTIDRRKVPKILGYGPPLTDLSQVGKMRDFYPLVIMRIENLVALINHDAIAEAIALLPLSICLSAARLETITTQTRDYMLQVSLYMVWELYSARPEIHERPKEPASARRQAAERGTRPHLPEKPSKSEEKITIFRLQWMKRFLNTVLLLIFAVRVYAQLGIERLGTHPLENFFGGVRMDAHDVNTEDEMMRTIAHSDIVQAADWDLGVQETAQKRTNVAGAHIGDPNSDARIMQIDVPANLHPREAALACLKAVHAGEVPLSESEQIAYLRFVEYLKAVKKAEGQSCLRHEVHRHIITSSSARIVTRLIDKSPECSHPPSDAGAS
jgi:hypothetical protein